MSGSQVETSGGTDAATPVEAEGETHPPIRQSKARRFAFRRRTLYVAISLLIALCASQLPFIYRRWQLADLAETIDARRAERTQMIDANFREYVGVFHVHSSLGGHSTGTLAEIIRAAQATRLDFVIMTEHTEADLDTHALTLAGTHGGVLFVGGHETKTASGDRLFLIPGSATANRAGTLPTAEFIQRERTPDNLVLIAYPEEFGSWGAADYDGIEVWNLFTNARRMNPIVMFFDWLWSGGSYPELLFTRFYERPTANLRSWDEQTVKTGKRLTALGGSDAHANIGINLQLASGERLVDLQLDPYERSFSLARLHVLIPPDQPFTTETLLQSVKRGRCFIAFDVLSDATGFRFTANATHTQGDEVNLSQTLGGLRLQISTPLRNRHLLFRNGDAFGERHATTTSEFAITEPGVYRVEAYFDDDVKLLADKPWIISNPIYVR